jgi:hypothetical protein
MPLFSVGNVTEDGVVEAGGVEPGGLFCDD